MKLGNGQPIASIIIPTYNRCASLRAALASLLDLDYPRREYEIVVVDNNSSDDTAVVVDSFSDRLDVRYVLEPRLSFTRARHTGAEASAGAYLMYIDDDVTVAPQWLAAAVAVFDADDRVGVVGGPIRPVYEVQPPVWLEGTPGLFNGLSLWDRGRAMHETFGVPGPNLSVRRAALDAVGGFPPDTMGIDVPGRGIQRIYVGDGDYGLCRRVRRAGYKVMYAPDVAVYHHIPAARLTKAWWRSRLAGEAYMHAFVDWHERPRDPPRLLLRLLWRSLRRSAVLGGRAVLNALRRKHWVEMLDFQWAYVTARLRIQRALLRNPTLGDRMWEIALTGALPDDMASVLEMLPQEP